MKRLLSILAIAAAALGTAGCGNDPVAPEPPPWVLPPTTPEAVLHGIEDIYNDMLHSAGERVAEYEDLLLPASGEERGFVFIYLLTDIGFPESWGLDTELAAHRNMFRALENAKIYHLELRLTLAPAEDLHPPDPEREGWQEIFAPSVYLRLMLTPNDGFEVNGAQANFVLAPVAGGRWAIAEWTDLVRPAPLAPPPLEPTTWAAIKAQFLP